MVKELDHKMSFQNLGFESVNGIFITGSFVYWSRNIDKVVRYKKLK